MGRICTEQELPVDKVKAWNATFLRESVYEYYTMNTWSTTDLASKYICSVTSIIGIMQLFSHLQDQNCIKSKI